MLDQTFSAHNFENIYYIESRKGHIKLDDMPERYSALVDCKKDIKKEIRANRKKGISNKDKLKKLKAELKLNEKERQKIILSYVGGLANEVGSNKFKFTLVKLPPHKGKEYFTIDKKDHASFFAMKQLQYNIRKTFKVKQADRHAILSTIKILFEAKFPIYVIRTDISRFYESIPQDRLLRLIENNTLLNHKSKSFIKAIIKIYEDIKYHSNANANLGVPRGVGISAYLSELYLRDLDTSISNRPEVMFYARYVDDIFIMLSSLPFGKTINEYYKDITKDFSSIGLSLKQPNDNSKKCYLLDCTKDITADMNYLGYKLCMKRTSKESSMIFHLSDNKHKKIKHKIDNAFKHFTETSKYSLKQARRDLIDAINFISGNTELYKSKGKIKVGIFYNNALLDKVEDLKDFTDHLHKKRILTYKKLWKSSNDKDGFSKALRRKIKEVDFIQRWQNKKMYKFNMQRIKELHHIVNDDEKKNKKNTIKV